MAENPPQTDTHNVIERTCRVVIDVKIRISQITPASVAGYFTPDETGEGLSWGWAERQNRLLLALLQNEEVLDQFLVSIVTGDLAGLLESERTGGLLDEAEDELFKKVYRDIDSADREFFEEARKDGILFENIELVHKAFATDLKRAEIKEVQAIKQDEA